MTRRATIWTFDLDGTKNGAIGHDILDLWTDDVLDQSSQMGFTIPAGHAKAANVILDAEVEYRGRRYFVTEIEYNRDGPVTTLEVECDATWYRLGEDQYVGTFQIIEATPQAGLVSILDGTIYDAGADSAGVSTVYSMNADDKSRLELLRIWAQITGLNLDFDTGTNTVRLTDFRGRDSGYSFRYGRNMRGVRKRTRPPRVTRLFPYGADDLTIAGVNGGREYIEDVTYYTDQGLTSSQVNALGLNKGRIWRNTQIVTDTDLLAAATIELAALGGEAVEYELDVVDISEFHPDAFITTADGTTLVERVEVGDTVRVYDPDVDDDLRPIVTRAKRFDLEPWRNVIELSTSPSVVSDGTTAARPSSADEWLQFVGPMFANFNIRNNAPWTIARIPLRWREGGKYHTTVDLSMIGAGAGTATLELYDATADAVVYTWTTTYADATTSRIIGSFAIEDIPAGAMDLRLRLTIAGSGGASPSNGVDITLETVADNDPVSWWMMVQGAVRETPTVAPNSITFDTYSTLTTWTVPDNVTEINIHAEGGGGGSLPGNSTRSCRNGAIVSAERFPVTPGETLTIIVDRNGGSVTGGPGNDSTAHGGGLSGVLRGDYTSDITLVPLANVLLVAAGGGGSAGITEGGIGGFFQGTNGESGAGAGGGGATQTQGGYGGGNAGGYMRGASFATTSVFTSLPGGGGGGIYGGGSGQGENGPFSGAGGGGGGASWVDPDSDSLIVQDNAASGTGLVTISWEDPDIG